MERKAVLEQGYPIRLNEIGPDGRMRLQPILDDMQDIAALHAEILNVGMSSLRALGIVWVLSRLKVSINEFPLYGDTLCITTWPGKFNRLFATRQFELKSKLTGKTIGCASSYWLTLKTDSLHPVPPSSVLKERLPENADRPVYFPEMGKLPQPAEMAKPLEMTTGQFQIDYNNHMNNSYYAVQMQEWLASKRGRPVRISEFQINFNHSCLFGDRLISAGTEDGSSFSVEGNTPDGKNVFQAAGNYIDTKQQ